MMSYLHSTVSYPVMNLVLNIQEELDQRQTPEYAKYEKYAASMRLRASIGAGPYQPVFAPHHRIQPPKLRSMSIQDLREMVPHVPA